MSVAGMNEPLAVREAPASYLIELAEQRVRPGYKQTEVGVIPEDWEVVSIGSLGTFSKGQGIRKDEAASGGIPCVRYGEIYTHYDDHVRSFNSFISSEVAKSSKRLRSGDLLFAGSGETKAEIGKCVAFLDDREAYAGGDIVILSPVKGYSPFFGYLFNAPIIARQKASKGQGDAVVHISATALSSVKIPLPPTKAEQEAIATALSDVDALLAKLDQLIAKKRDLKQAAMQQLLTGSTRLPGFGGEWEVRRLGDVCRITTGKKDVNEGNPTGQYPFFTCARENTFSDSYSFDGEAILIAGNGEVGNLGYFKGKFEAYQRTYVLQGFTANVSYLWHQLSAHLVKSLGIGTIGSSIPYIKMENLVGFEFQSPLDKGEQTAIATTLSDMDAEIAALEARRDKTRDLKQGMMQELLTGRIRLV